MPEEPKIIPAPDNGGAVLPQAVKQEGTPFTRSNIAETVGSAVKNTKHYRDLFNYGKQNKISLTDYARSITREISTEAGRLMQTEGAITDVKTARADLRIAAKNEKSVLRAALTEEYRKNGNKIRSNPAFKEDLASRIGDSRQLEQIAVQKKILDSLERSLRNSVKEEALKDTIAAITPDQAEARREELLAGLQTQLDKSASPKDQKSLYLRMGKVKRMPVSMLQRAIAEKRLKEGPQTTPETARESIQPGQKADAEATVPAEARQATERAKGLINRIGLRINELGIQRVQTALERTARGVKNAADALKKPAVRLAVATLTVTAFNLALPYIQPYVPIPGLDSVSSAEAPEHKTEPSPAPAANPAEVEKSKGETVMPVENLEAKARESAQQIQAKRAESIRQIGGEERLARLQELSKPFMDAQNAYLHLKVKGYDVPAAFVENSTDYSDQNENLPKGEGRSSPEEVQAIIDQSLIEDPNAQKIDSLDKATNWVRNKIRAGTDCAGLVGGIYEKAYEKLGLGDFYKRVGIEKGNLSASAFLRLAQQGKDGFFIMQDKATNILTPGTIILFTNDNNPNEAGHGIVVIGSGLTEDGKIYVDIAENTDVTQGKEKGAHTLRMVFEKPEGRLADQEITGTVYDFGQLMQDDPDYAETVAKSYGVENIKNLTPDQVREHPKLQKVSYTSRFYGKGYVIIGNSNLTIGSTPEERLQQKYSEMPSRQGVVV